MAWERIFEVGADGGSIAVMTRGGGEYRLRNWQECCGKPIASIG